MGFLAKTVSNVLCRQNALTSGVKIKESLLQTINRRYIVSLAASTQQAGILERAANVVDTSVSHFDIRNLLQQEQDLSIFTLDKVSKLEADLVTAEHPIIGVAHEIFEHDETKIRTSLGGFCLLLLAKSLQSVPSNNITLEMWKKQKIFAECYEMIDKAMYLHHHAIIDIPTEIENSQSINAKNKGNKLAVLGGDYLFSYAIVRLSREVRPATVFDFIGASIDEFCINHFDDPARLESIKTSSSVSNSSLSLFSAQDQRNNYPWNKVDSYYWEKYGGYCSTHLLAYCSQYVCKMAHLASMRYEKAAFKFGYNLRLLWNLKDDLESLENEKAKLNVISLPLILYLEANPEFRSKLSELDLDDNQLREEIRRILLNSDAIKWCQSSILKYSNECLKALKVFPNCSSRDILISICEEN